VLLVNPYLTFLQTLNEHFDAVPLHCFGFASPS